MNAKSWLKVEWVNKRSRGKVWLKNEPFQKCWPDSTFLASTNKANMPKIRALQQVHGAKALGTNHLHHPGHLTHTSWCSSCQEMWIRQRMWSWQRKPSLRWSFTVFVLNRKKLGTCSLMTIHLKPWAGVVLGRESGPPDLVLFCHLRATKSLVRNIS